MAKIEININYDQDITVFKITGTLNSGELLESYKSCSEDEVTKLLLLDFTDASWANLPTADLRANTAKGSIYSSKGMRSAFVFSNDADYGIGRMFEAFATIEKYDSEICLFRSIDEAKEWLMEAEDTDKALSSV